MRLVMIIDSKIKQLSETLHPLEVKLICAFKENAQQDDVILAKNSGLDAAQVRTAVEWLKAKEVIAVLSSEAILLASLTEFGERQARYGIPEIQILNLLRRVERIPLSEIAVTISKDLNVALEEAISADEVQPACGMLKAAGCVTFAEGGVVVLADANKNDSVFKDRQALIEKLQQKKQVVISELSQSEQEILNAGAKKRGKAKGSFRVDEKKTNQFALTDFGSQVLSALNELGITGEEIQELTPEIIADGSWRKKGFRKYNISLKPGRVVSGKFHAYRQYVDFLKNRMVGLGFQEMFGSVVETEFWDMDALFMPQFHSAREIHDVYFVKEPKYAKEIPEPFLSNVAEAHCHGASDGKHGWGYLFDKEKCKRLILRSQTTALSARTLAAGPAIPGKYFAIARCFRYDQVDASHAPDFFQVEGIVVDPDATFKSLLGLLEVFAKEIAMAKEIKFAPAYFPFTEPSVEVHMKHPKLGWMELGGAGIFRPEVCRPLGIDAPVLAWGLGTDRMAMVALGVSDIRDLCSSDLDYLRMSRIRGLL